MKMKQRHLRQGDRDRIEAMLNSGHKQCEIAKVLDFDKSSISRELKRNPIKIRQRGGTTIGPYKSSVAQHKAYVRRRNSKLHGQKINGNKELEKYIIERLKKHWSPDDISGRMRLDHEPFYASKNLIYDWLYSPFGQRYCYLLCTHQFKKKKHTKKTQRVMIPDRIGIEERPAEVASRETFGHYEADTIVSGKKHNSTDSLSVVQERKAKYFDMRKLENLAPKKFTESFNNMVEKFTKKETVTLDNGIENRDHKNLIMTAYCCDPYASWQKGGVENMNKMIRWFIPKGANIANYSHQKIASIVVILNKKPRKSLGYKTPLEVMLENNLLVKKPVRKVAFRG
jgi:IS30 family transposase